MLNPERNLIDDGLSSAVGRHTAEQLSKLDAVSVELAKTLVGRCSWGLLETALIEGLLFAYCAMLGRKIPLVPGLYTEALKNSFKDTKFIIHGGVQDG